MKFQITVAITITSKNTTGNTILIEKVRLEMFADEHWNN
jgi:hypothetical protein